MGLAREKEKKDIMNINGSGLPMSQKTRGVKTDEMVEMDSKIMFRG